jgi:hypothetical protein
MSCTAEAQQAAEAKRKAARKAAGIGVAIDGTGAGAVPGGQPK